MVAYCNKRLLHAQMITFFLIPLPIALTEKLPLNFASEP
jgi:hypothetical protein